MFLMLLYVALRPYIACSTSENLNFLQVEFNRPDEMARSDLTAIWHLGYSLTLVLGHKLWDRD